MPYLRDILVKVALEWEEIYSVIPSITSSISEFDAAKLVGCDEHTYSTIMRGRTAVSKGYDFMFDGKRYQIKANRPSGKPGSKVTIVPKANNYNWDILIWILYDEEYNIVEAWMFDVATYKAKFAAKKVVRPADMRTGKRIYPNTTPLFPGGFSGVIDPKTGGWIWNDDDADWLPIIVKNTLDVLEEHPETFLSPSYFGKMARNRLIEEGIINETDTCDEITEKLRAWLAQH
jgi:hypothetical protein